jgi:hypothetical protein
MCQQATTLAANGDARQIWRCEHGTIHLNWEQVTVRLRPNDFRRMVRLLEEGVTELNFNKLCDGSLILVPQENGYHQFWCGNIMLLLDALAFLQLVQLARAAAQQLDELGLNGQHLRLLGKNSGDEPRFSTN